MRTLLRWVKFIGLFFWIVIVFIIGTKLALDNQQLVNLNLLGLNAEVNSGLLLVLTLLTGILIGVLPAVVVLFFTRIKIKRVDNKLKSSEKALSNLRLVQTQDS